MRFAIDAPDPRATNPDPVLLKEVKRARRCFDALVSGRIGSVAELASLEGISDRYEAVASVVDCQGLEALCSHWRLGVLRFQSF